MWVAVRNWGGNKRISKIKQKRLNREFIFVLHNINKNISNQYNDLLLTT